MPACAIRPNVRSNLGHYPQPYRICQSLSGLPAVGTHLFYGGELTVRRTSFMI